MELNMDSNNKISLKIKKFNKWFKKRSFLFNVTASIVAAIIFSVITSIIFLLSSPQKEEVITFKDIRANFPKEHTPLIDDAIENYNCQNYSCALTELYACSTVIKKFENSKTRNALINAAIGSCFFEQDSLKKSEKFLITSYQHYKSAYICKMLSDLYYKLYLETGQEEYLEKHKHFSDELWNYIKFSSKFINNKLFEQNFITLGNNSIKTNNKNYILVIGINKYLDSNFNELKYAVNDAKIFSQSLRIIFNNTEIIELFGENATKENILKSIHELKLKFTSDDRLIIYFSGHGYVTNNIENNIINKVDFYKQVERLSKELIFSRFLITYDADIDNLAKSAICLDELFNQLDSITFNNSPLIFIDACNNILQGDYRNNYLSLNCTRKSENKEFTNSILNEIYDKDWYASRIDTLFDQCEQDVNYYPPIIISSSSIGEKSGESSKLKQGIFSYFLIDALKNINEIDKDNNNKISVGELVLEIEKNIDNYCLKTKTKQSVNMTYKY